MSLFRGHLDRGIVLWRARPEHIPVLVHDRIGDDVNGRLPTDLKIARVGGGIRGGGKQLDLVAIGPRRVLPH